VGSLDDGNKSRIISYRDQEKGQIPSRIMVRLTATYTRTGIAVPSIISELPRERAEALFIAVAAVVLTAGEQYKTRAQAACHAGSAREKRRPNGRAP